MITSLPHHEEQKKASASNFKENKEYKEQHSSSYSRMFSLLLCYLVSDVYFLPFIYTHTHSRSNRTAGFSHLHTLHSFFSICILVKTRTLQIPQFQVNIWQNFHQQHSAKASRKPARILSLQPTTLIRKGFSEIYLSWSKEDKQAQILQR